jgi:hypothetical protein
MQMERDSTARPSPVKVDQLRLAVVRLWRGVRKQKDAPIWTVRIGASNFPSLDADAQVGVKTSSHARRLRVPRCPRCRRHVGTVVTLHLEKQGWLRKKYLVAGFEEDIVPRGSAPGRLVVVDYPPDRCAYCGQDLEADEIDPKVAFSMSNTGRTYRFQDLPWLTSGKR